MQWFTCRGCGLEMLGRPGRAFCSNACQRSDEQRRLVDRWLSTGEGRPDSRHAHYIRTYLAAAQEGCCAVCGMTSEWQGRPLVFGLDHIDGTADNNARSNLRMVCPNCDSQLPTYKNRNLGSVRSSRRQGYTRGQSY